MKKLILLLLIAISVNLSVSAQTQTAPPKAEVRNVTDEYFGVKITDPYRWMEDLESVETQKWMREQADYSRAYLDKLPVRDEILKRLDELRSETNVGNVKRNGERYFYIRSENGESAGKLFVRENLSGAERVLLDLNKLSHDGKPAAMTGYSVSPNGKTVAYLLAAGGGEFGTLRFIDVASGKELDDVIESTAWDVENEKNWTPDSRAFAYRRFNLQTPSERYSKTPFMLHSLGTKAAADIALFGYEVNPKIKLEPASFPDIFLPVNAKYAVAQINPDESDKLEFYIAPISSLSESPIPWRKIVSTDDEVTAVAEHADYLYLLTHKNAPRYKITRINLKKPDVKTAETVFGASEAVIENMAVTKDALYVQILDGGSRRVFAVDYKTLKQTEIKTAFPSSLSIQDASPVRDTVLLNTASWTKPELIYEYNPKTKAMTDTKLAPPSPIDMSNIEIINTKVKSHDGAMIPLVILYKKGLKMNGTNPIFMNGYGAYGIENTSPFFNPPMLPWLERGGVFVFTGVRGGGEYGEEWHFAGKEKTKPNTWKDFIACAEYLIEKKYTSTAHLGISGVSAGGILISNAIAERPELFGAAIISVGINNPLRLEATPNPNVYEFGSSKTEAGFKNLLAMDGYLKIKNDVKYPAVLITQGINDPRVAPWMSVKMAARLQAATSSGKPVLLRIDYDAGHGFGSSSKQRNEKLADTFAFLFEQLK